ncbi:MAG TPA: ATP-binding protein [Thermodesulfovibrionales bacterium]|nr:ATP-binding protein [Thermodesulfovibrionales bacterium]
MKKLGLILGGLFLFVILVSTLELHLMRQASSSITTRITLLILLNVNIIALLTLMFFVAKALTKLYFERKRKVLGSRFKTKIVVVFVILTSIPSVLLFLGASGLVTNYIDRWFTPQFRQPIDSTLGIARAFYEIERKKTLEAARSIVSTGTTPMEYTVTHLSEIPDNPSDAITEAFGGEEGTEIISGEDGDTVRAVVPENTGGKHSGVLIVESHIPRDITRNMEKIKSAYEDYMQLEAWKQPLKLNYQLFLGFFTLIVIFTALWVSLRIARGISEPIQMLAEATGEIASGNLEVDITLKRDDEIGLLINSFNHMVKELKDGKASLQKAYVESDRRRLFMENILENIQSGVISLDAEGTILAMNTAACAILNVTSESVMGKNYRELLSLLRSDSLLEMIRGIKLRTLGMVEKEIWATIKGKRTGLRVSLMGLRNNASEYVGLLVVFDDLTNVIKAQKALAWQEVARRIAHEVKNPLTPIKLSTERMLKKWEQKDEDFPQVFERSTRTIIKEVDSLRNLVDEFSRFEKMPEIHRSPTILADIIDEVVNLYRDYKGLSVRVLLPEDMPRIDMDGEQFKRVLINLFENAIQAMHGEGTIEVTVHLNVSSNRVFMDVADNGPGIREEDKEKLFLPYFSTKREGTGLGLAIAHRIVKEHMGYLRVRDNEPRGTVFGIEMPIKEE